MSTVQMNLRIDPTLKREGDEALAQAGYTPTQAVRALWDFAARHRNRPSEIREALSFGEANPSEEELDEEVKRKLEIVEYGANIGRNFLKSMGLTDDQIDRMPVNDTPYAELREQSLIERYGLDLS